jgi:hypothetical protein
MTVNHLREALTLLVGLLRAGEAKPATTRELAEFIQATAPFGDLTLKAFVRLAEAGRTPLAEKAGTRTPGGKAKFDPAAVAAEVRDLYARAADPGVTEDHIRAACGRLAGLGKDPLVTVADGIDLSGMKSKKKDEIVAAITARLVERKGAAVRRQLADRPTPESGTGGQPARLIGAVMPDAAGGS